MCGLLFEYDVRLSVKLYFAKSYMNIRTKQKEQASACSFCFTCEAVKERFELRATPPGEKTVLRTVFSDDRRYLQSIGLNFRNCFANIKRKISLPQPRENNTNTIKSAFVLFFSNDYFGIKIKR